MTVVTFRQANLKVVLLLAFLALSCHVYARPSGKVIFYLDRERADPVVRLDQIEPLSEGVRAILAMYALQNGAGCSGGNETISCALTNALDLNGQCSEIHIKAVRRWFRGGIPVMGGYGPETYRNVDEPSGLENICYRSPDGATFQTIWDLLRVNVQGRRVHVEANGMWLARDRSGSMHYSTDFEIEGHTIKVIRHNGQKR